MTAPNPIAVSDKTAAKMFEIPHAEFRRLVDEGLLPRPVKLGQHERWKVEDLERVMSGQSTELAPW